MYTINNILDIASSESMSEFGAPSEPMLPMFLYKNAYLLSEKYIRHPPCHSRPARPAHSRRRRSVMYEDGLKSIDVMLDGNPYGQSALRYLKEVKSQISDKSWLELSHDIPSNEDEVGLPPPPCLPSPLALESQRLGSHHSTTRPITCSSQASHSPAIRHTSTFPRVASTPFRLLAPSCAPPLLSFPSPVVFPNTPFLALLAHGHTSADGAHHLQYREDLILGAEGVGKTVRRGLTHSELDGRSVLALGERKTPPPRPRLTPVRSARRACACRVHLSVLGR